MQIKIFSSGDHPDMEGDVNKWIESNKDKYKILNIEITSNKWSTKVMVVYQDLYV